MPVPTIRRALSLALLAPLLMSCGPGAPGETIHTATTQDDPTAFSVSRHLPPPGRRWIMCAGGREQGLMKAIASDGDSISLTNGHVLTVNRNAVPDSTDFVFVEPRSPQVIVYASAPRQFDRPGVRLRLSGDGRPGCNVSGSVIARIVPGDSAQEISSRAGAPANTIETVDPLLELSAYALAR